MENCLHCGKAAHYPFEVMEVQTLHVRDLKGESRVQALGERRAFAICQTCAAAALEEIRNPRRKLLRSCGVFTGIFLLGVVLCLLFWSTQGALRLMGLAAIVCGGFGVYSTLQSTEKAKQAYAALSESDALTQAAWETLVKAAPKKDKDTDLTYFPIDTKTLAMTSGELALAFDLLPMVAVKAHALLHGDATEESE